MRSHGRINKEGDSILEDTEAGTSTQDVGLILAAQKVEHYEISTYGGSELSLWWLLSY